MLLFAAAATLAAAHAERLGEPSDPEDLPRTSEGVFRLYARGIEGERNPFARLLRVAPPETSRVEFFTDTEDLGLLNYGELPSQGETTDALWETKSTGTTGVWLTDPRVQELGSIRGRDGYLWIAQVRFACEATESGAWTLGFQFTWHADEARWLYTKVITTQPKGQNAPLLRL